MEIIYIFSKERCSYTLGNRTFLYFRNNPLHLPLSPPPPPKKSPYISENRNYEKKS